MHIPLKTTLLRVILIFVYEQLNGYSPVRPSSVRFRYVPSRLVLAYGLPSRWLGDRASFSPSTQQTCRSNIKNLRVLSPRFFVPSKLHSVNIRSSVRPISTGQLNTLPCLHTRPIYLVVFLGLILRKGNLILRCLVGLRA